MSPWTATNDLTDERLADAVALGELRLGNVASGVTNANLTNNPFVEFRHGVTRANLDGPMASGVPAISKRCIPAQVIRRVVSWVPVPMAADHSLRTRPMEGNQDQIVNVFVMELLDVNGQIGRAANAHVALAPNRSDWHHLAVSANSKNAIKATEHFPMASDSKAIESMGSQINGFNLGHRMSPPCE